MEVNYNLLNGWTFLGSNKNRYPNPDTLITVRKELTQDHDSPAYPTSVLFKSKLNTRWYGAFGNTKGFPGPVSKCELCAQNTRFNYYFRYLDDIKRVCKPCSKEVRQLNKESLGDAFDLNKCLVCDSYTKGSNVCTGCLSSVNSLMYCGMCYSWVINDKVRKPCNDCSLKFFYSEHLCGTDEYYETYCSHLWQECSKCDTRFLKEHICGDGTKCERCELTFNSEHLCDKRIYTCSKCFKDVSYGLYKETCNKCGNPNIILRHNCYNEYKQSGVCFKDTLCYCDSTCPVCWSKHEVTNQCFVKTLKRQIPTGKLRGVRLCELLDDPKCLIRHIHKLPNPEKVYLKHILELVKTGKVTKQLMVSVADSN